MGLDRPCLHEIRKKKSYKIVGIIYTVVAGTNRPLVDSIQNQCVAKLVGFLLVWVASLAIVAGGRFPLVSTTERRRRPRLRHRELPAFRQNSILTVFFSAAPPAPSFFGSGQALSKAHRGSRERPVRQSSRQDLRSAISCATSSADRRCLGKARATGCARSWQTAFMSARIRIDRAAHRLRAVARCRCAKSLGQPVCPRRFRMQTTHRAGRIGSPARATDVTMRAHGPRIAAANRNTWPKIGKSGRFATRDSCSPRW